MGLREQTAFGIKGIETGDLVFPTQEAADRLPELRKLWHGGTVKQIEGGVAEVHFVEVHRINLANLTNDKDGKTAFDPVL